MACRVAADRERRLVAGNRHTRRPGIRLPSWVSHLKGIDASQRCIAFLTLRSKVCVTVMQERGDFGVQHLPTCSDWLLGNCTCLQWHMWIYIQLLAEKSYQCLVYVVALWPVSFLSGHAISMRVFNHFCLETPMDIA
jgi:hypothetical protein